MQFRKHIAAFFLLLLVTMVLSVFHVSAATATVAVYPSISNVTAGNTFSVNVTVANINNFTAWQLYIYYLNSVLNCTGAAEGPFLSSSGSTYFGSTITNNYNATHGRLLAYCTIFGNNSANGSGVIMTATFMAIGGGTTSLHLSGIELDDEKIPPGKIPYTAVDGTVSVTGGVHDVSAANLASYQTVIGRSLCGNLSVTAQNLGAFAENFNVTIYANETTTGNVTSITALAFNLASFSSETRPFLWNTTNFAYGNYSLIAAADIVSGDINPANNNSTGGHIQVSVLGDITGGTPRLLDFVPDGKVDMKDVGTVAKFFSQNVPPAPPNCDLTGPTASVPDEKVDMRDIGTAAKHFGQHL